MYTPPRPSRTALAVSSALMLLCAAHASAADIAALPEIHVKELGKQTASNYTIPPHPQPQASS